MRNSGVGMVCRLLGLICLFTLPVMGQTLPALNWTGPRPYTDWVNVKLDVTPAAAGDGFTDDTNALQAALDMLAINQSVGAKKVVYLPPGTYKITSPLRLSYRVGTGMIGHGNSTIIKWAGASGGRMFWSDGASYHRFIGIVWDGQGVAAVGVDHDSSAGVPSKLYETSILHRYEEYRGFTDAGIRIGQSQGAATATAEVQYYNCLFKNSNAGIKILWANDYDNQIQACQFLDNNYGVYAGQGNYNLYRCHFESSAIADIYASSHTSSIRGCTSKYSNRFILGPSFVSKNAHAIQDCYVSHWTAADGAIKWASGGPITVSDCTFANGPNSNPPIQESMSSATLRVISSNNTYAPATRLTEDSPKIALTDVTGRTRGGVVTSSTESLYSAQNPLLVPTGQIFDAVRDFGAASDGTADDTDEVQACINAARNAGNGAVAYFPCGIYKITSTITAPRGHYRIAGSGRWSRLKWGGSVPGGPMLLVDNPQELTVEALCFWNPLDGAVQKIRQTATNTSRARYDYVWFAASIGGRIPMQDPYNGIELLNLPDSATVLLDNVVGVINLSGSSRAKVIGNIAYGRIMVSNSPGYAKSGYTGFAFSSPFGIEVKDNQDLILGEVYTEGIEVEYFLHVSRNSGTGSGRVTLGGGGKMSYVMGDPPVPLEMVNINNYLGRVFIGMNACNPYSDTDPKELVTPVFNHTGTNACDLTLAGMAFTKIPTFNVGGACRKTVYANSGYDNGELTIPESFPTDWMTPSAAAFDDFAELGDYHSRASFIPTTKSANLTATAISSSMIRLSWGQGYCPNESGFKIERSTDGVNFVSLTSVTAQVSPNTVTCDMPGLNASTTYWFRVRTYNLAADSDYSNVASATTSAAGGELRLQAESYSGTSGTPYTGAFWNGTMVTCQNNSWLKFDNVNLGTGFSNFVMAYTCPDTGNGTIEVRLDSETGQLLGTFSNIPATGGWGSYATWKELGTALSGGTGAHSVYLIFKIPQGIKVDYFKFQ